MGPGRPDTYKADSLEFSYGPGVERHVPGSGTLLQLLTLSGNILASSPSSLVPSFESLVSRFLSFFFFPVIVDRFPPPRG